MVCSTALPRTNGRAGTSSSSISSTEPDTELQSMQNGSRRRSARTSTPADAIAASVDSDDGEPSAGKPGQPEEEDPYDLPPTVPSPYDGGLERCLDAIMEFGQQHPVMAKVTTELQQPPSTKTNWPTMITSAVAGEDEASRRHHMEEFLFLMTRTLLPELIAENRQELVKLYEAKKNLSQTVILRYDMLSERRRAPPPRSKDLPVIPCTTILPGHVNPPEPVPSASHPHRRPLKPNVLPTLLLLCDDANDDNDNTTEPTPIGPAVRTKLGHHPTILDDFLLRTDDEVASWSPDRLLFELGATVLHMQWLRDNTEKLQASEEGGWAEFEARAEENDWIRGDGAKKRGGSRDGVKSERGRGRGRRASSSSMAAAGRNGDGDGDGDGDDVGDGDGGEEVDVGMHTAPREENDKDVESDGGEAGVQAEQAAAAVAGEQQMAASESEKEEGNGAETIQLRRSGRLVKRKKWVESSESEEGE